MPKIKKNKDITPNKLKPFEKREKLHALSLFVTIVGREQSDYFINAYQKLGASLSMDLFAYSMPPRDVLTLLGNTETKKEILFTICRKDDIPSLMKIAKDRFRISRASKGIAFACPIDAVSGISVYKFLADQNKEERVNQNESK
ncbi:MAG: hypothetical protein WCR67_00775 [Bacilli bacterium]